MGERLSLLGDWLPTIFQVHSFWCFFLALECLSLLDDISLRVVLARPPAHLHGVDPCAVRLHLPICVDGAPGFAILRNLFLIQCRPLYVRPLNCVGLLMIYEHANVRGLRAFFLCTGGQPMGGPLLTGVFESAKKGTVSLPSYVTRLVSVLASGSTVPSYVTVQCLFSV